MALSSTLSPGSREQLYCSHQGSLRKPIHLGVQVTILYQAITSLTHGTKLENAECSINTRRSSPTVMSTRPPCAEAQGRADWEQVMDE